MEGMDDRKRQINEAEQRKKEQAAALDALRERIGEAVLGRTGDFEPADASVFAELAAYRRLQGEIAGSQESIKAAEEKMLRLKELEERIEAREREEGACSKDLAGAYGRLGKLVLEEAERAEGGEREFCAPFLSQAEELQTKVSSLEDRLSGLEQKEKGNVFTWIGKSAQSLVLRSFLGKAQENLDQLRRTVGERFSRAAPESRSGETAATDALRDEIEAKRSEQAEISADAAGLKSEKRAIADGFSAEGGPTKYVQSLKNNISNAQGELKVLYRKIGAEAALGAGAEATDERARIVASFLEPDDAEAMAGAARAAQSISDCEEVIGKLKAAIAIDEEKAKVDKYRRLIQEKRERIAQAEKGILELEESIRDSEASIEKLREIL